MVKDKGLPVGTRSTANARISVANVEASMTEKWRMWNPAQSRIDLGGAKSVRKEHGKKKKKKRGEKKLTDPNLQ